MARPPSAPTVKVIPADRLPGVATSAVGAAGTVGSGTAVTDTPADAAPAPAAFSARSRTDADTLLVRPGTTTGDDSSAGENAVQEPPSTLYS